MLIFNLNSPDGALQRLASINAGMGLEFSVRFISHGISSLPLINQAVSNLFKSRKNFMYIPSFYPRWTTTAQTVNSRPKQTINRTPTADTVHFSAWYDVQSPHHYDSRWRGKYSFKISTNDPNGDTKSPYNEASFKNYPGDYDLSKNLIKIRGRKYGMSPRARNELEAAQTHARRVRIRIIDQYLMDEDAQRQLDQAIEDADQEIQSVLNTIAHSASEQVTYTVGKHKSRR